MYETQAEIDAFLKCLFQFKWVKRLGDGAFGWAILVYDEVEKVNKVFKLPKDSKTTEALRNEGEIFRRLRDELQDPHIVRLHQYGMVRLEWNGVSEERYYLNVAFGGSSLRSKLGDYRVEFDENSNPRYHGGGRRLPIDEALRISIEVCEGLEALHGFRGAPFRMLHRDIKPENILIDDETGVARITDFGISRVIDRTSGLVSFAGTLIYMDPECFKGHASFQSDLYSLGVVMYEMLTGELPFHNFEERLEGPPQPPHELVREIPADFSAYILRTLETKSERRYAGASDLLADLRHLRAKLNPLGERYRRISAMEDGRLLCEDMEAKERIAVRVVNTTASIADFARSVATIENMRLPTIDVVRRHFRNEQITGIVSAVPPGPTLHEKFGQGARTIAQIEELCRIMATACDALRALHNVGICHGLLSPFSICLTPKGPVLLEAGHSAILHARHLTGCSTDSFAGIEPLIPYWSPQALSASQAPGPKDDIYSVGAILYNLLVGRFSEATSAGGRVERYPLSDEDRERVIRGEAIAEGSSNPRQTHDLIPPNLAAAITKALHWNPHDRFETAKELADSLRACRWPDDTVDALIADALQTYPPGGSDDALLEACRLIDRALEIDFGNVSAHLARGVIYSRNESYTFAIEELRMVNQVAPTQESLDLLGQCYAQCDGHCIDAVCAFSEALKFGENAEILDRLARAYQAAGDHDQAILVMQKSIHLEKDESIRERRLAVLKDWTNVGPAKNARENGVSGGVNDLTQHGTNNLTHKSDTEI